MLIDLIRHGEPVGGPRYRGHAIDDPLSDLGWRQMWAAVGMHCPWQRIVTSPLRRCRDFAQALAQQENRPCDIEPELREIGFGAWEGKTKADLCAERPDEFHAFYRDPVRHTPSGAEPVTDFFERISNCLASLPERFTEDHLLLVVHAGVIRASIAWAINAEPDSMYRVQVRNASLTRLAVDGDQTSLIFHDGQSGS